MNKYLDALNNICEECDYPDYESEKLIKELIDKAEKYKWHDVKKHPEDIPVENGRYWVCYYWYSELQTRVVKSYDEAMFRNGKFISGGKVVGWKYIEEFEDENL